MFKRAGAAYGSVWIKICGITNEADARCALDCGADALGFISFRGSKRYLDVKSAENWLSRLPPEVPKIAVLVNPTWSEAIQISDYSFIDSVQLHGKESREFCRRLAERGVRFTKALPVRDENSLLQTPQLFTNTVILDSFSTRGFGGTGEVFPWRLGRDFVENHPELQVILAGGLTPDNVGEAIAAVRPFGVDVTSGVESSAGQKDRKLLQAFISAARRD